MDIVTSLLTGGVGAAIVASLHAIFIYKMKRRDAQEDKDDNVIKALRYLMLYVIQERCKEHIANGSITLEERRSLRHWHKLYHDGLGGNGDADLLLKQVDEIETDFEN